jgi:hypothetical protein
VWKGSWEEKYQWYESVAGSGPLLDPSFRSLECDLMLNAPPDITYQSMQLEDANFVLQ